MHENKGLKQITVFFITISVHSMVVNKQTIVMVTLSGYTGYTVILYRYRVIETLPFERNLR